MIEVIVTLFAIYGLAFLLKDSAGPFDIMDWIRRHLFQLPKVGPFFFKLFDCYFCLGCHCGWIVYLLSHESYNFQFFILWTLAGGAISLILNGVIERLHRE
jgi:hypothetical protein